MQTLNNKNNLQLLAIFLLGGILAGIASLVFSSVLPGSLSATASLSTIVVLVLIEEAAKLIAIWLIIRSFFLMSDLELGHFIIFTLSLGLGFGLFELFLILLSSSEFTSAMAKPLLIHLATSLLYGIGIYYTLRTKMFFAIVISVLLSLLLHIWYNVVVATRIL